MLPRDEEFWHVATPREARDRILRALSLELLGPEDPEERLRESPLTRYTVGALAPFGTPVPDEEHDEEIEATGEDEETGAIELGSPVSQSITPSSIGISFLVPAEITKLGVKTTWGDYRTEELSEELGASDVGANDAHTTSPGGQAERSKPRKRTTWIRIRGDPAPVTIDLKPDKGLQRVRILSEDDVTLEHLCRTVGNRLAVSVFLVNRRARKRGDRPSADRWIFQPTLSVRGLAGEPGPFLPRELEPTLAHTDRDRESNRLLFRNRREFAVGHGCAAEWNEVPGVDRASVVRSELIPVFEIPRIDARSFGGQGLRMEVLANASSGLEIGRMLSPLLDEYEGWVREKKSFIKELASDLQSVAQLHLVECSQALARMRRGVQLLERDRDAFLAFRFANRAMLLQRSHTLWAHQRKRDPQNAPLSPKLEGVWRPFQLAFILLNLEGLIDPTHEDRATADLLWFPTGGGKTEAYLGLAAFAMALRRRRSIPGVRTDAGLTVLMRYTLRLLTIQQFQRAAALICACEVLRLADLDTWGSYRFSIGLWLGMKATPNSHDEGRQALARIQQDPTEEGANPCQLESCPWCGEALNPSHYWTDGEAVRTRVACSRNDCDFSKTNTRAGLPVLVVDEEIYLECPSMLIATVDKFAQMPWNGDVQSLFGFVARECDRCGFLSPSTEHVRRHRAAGRTGGTGSVRTTERLAPPDLIIQDELHLISGPLGTLVGLYESAVDFLSSRQHGSRVIEPKVIASTATVRRAFEQVQAVFNRRVRVFPPPGLEPEDSFFAVEQPISDQAPGRVYVGVCAPGKSMKTAYIRVAASLMSSASGLGSKAHLAEPYTTLVSYFNSLRELGGAIRLMDDDVPARLEQLRTAGLPRHHRPVYVELTSRIRQEQIPHLLRRLEQRQDTARSEDDPLPLDAVLASNMISVGVDVDRLGLMTVSGQPKTTAEYIQASSRVGRQPWGPGLVLTLYNWSRPRDLSHYERFRHYHATLYRHVEAVSATPFSSRALDRGIRGTYVAMARLGSDAWSGELGASLFDPKDPRISAVVEHFRRRAETVADAMTAAALDTSLKGLGDEWWGYRRSALRYGWRSPNPAHVPIEDVLLRVPEGGVHGHWPAPQSLREVEQQSFVRVLGLHGS